MRACTKCGVVKPLEAFPPVRRGEPRLQTWCRTCFADYGARYYSEHRETARARLRANFLAARAENKRQLIEYLQAHPCIDCGETDIIVLEFDHVRDKRDNIATLVSSSRTWPRILAEVQKCEVRCANCHRLKTAQRRGHRPRVAPVRSVIRRGQLTLDDIGSRSCRVCRRTQALASFPFRSRAANLRQWICLECQRSVSRAWYERNRSEQIARARQRLVRWRLGLLARVYQYLRAHPCVDCGETNPVLLDFDHQRDKVDDVRTFVSSTRSCSVITAEIAKCVVRCANCHRKRTARLGRHYRVVLAPTSARMELSETP